MSASDAGQRTVAAEVLPYARDKQAVSTDLGRAMTDPSPDVRNAAIRALVVMAGALRPIRIPGAPFVALLNSIEWTDRNKSAAALFTLTSTTRDPALLASMRSQALSALSEMAGWHSGGHAQPAFYLLGRIGGLSDETIARFWDSRDLRSVLAAVEISQ